MATRKKKAEAIAYLENQKQRVPRLELARLKPVESVVEAIEQLLELAKSGRLRALVGMADLSSGELATVHLVSDGTRAGDLLLGLERAKIKIVMGLEDL